MIHATKPQHWQDSDLLVEASGSGTVTGFFALSVGDMSTVLTLAHGDELEWAEAPRFEVVAGALFIPELSGTTETGCRVIVMRVTGGPGSGDLEYEWIRRGGQV